eukprot:5894557-Lingulodinium_polyedra.AAC.1
MAKDYANGDLTKKFMLDKKKMFVKELKGDTDTDIKKKRPTTDTDIKKKRPTTDASPAPTPTSSRSAQPA